MATVIWSAAQWNELVSPLGAGLYQLGSDITFTDTDRCTTKIMGSSVVFDGKGRSVYLDRTTGSNFPPFDLRGGKLLNVTVRGGNIDTPRAVTLPMSYGGVVACGSTTFDLYKGVVRNCHSRNVNSGNYGGGIVGAAFGDDTSVIEFCSTDNQPAAAATGGIAGTDLHINTTVRDCLFLGTMAGASTPCGQLTPLLRGVSGTMTIRRCYFGGTIPSSDACGMIGYTTWETQTINIDECIFAGTNNRGAIYGNILSSTLTVNITNSYILTVQSGGASAISSSIVSGAVVNLDSMYITDANNYAISSTSHGTITAINGVYTNAVASLFGTYGSVSSGTITQSLAAAYAASLPASWDANMWTPASDGTSGTFHTLKAFENAAVYGASYTGYNAVPAFATTLTNGSAGFAVSATALTVSESGSTATFDVVLLAAPDDDVVFTVTSADTGEVTVSLSTLTFTTANWYTPQTVTVTGVNDNIADGNIAVTVTVAVNTDASTGTAYDGVSARTVTVTNTDIGVAGITLSETALTVSETSTTDTFTVLLDAQPLDTVTLLVTSANTDKVTVSPSTLTFGTDDWNTPQTVTVTGVDAALADGNIDTLVTISISGGDGGAYDGVSDSTVTVVSIDAPNIAPSTSSVSGMIGEAVSVTVVNSGGSGVTYTVSPSLPAGLSINSSTGAISGTPTAATASATYTITATNTDGTDTATLTIVVIVDAPMITPSVSVDEPVALTAGVAMTPITVSNSGGATTTYSVSPALPAGLSLDTTTGTISGTPLGTRSTTITTHTVTATNDGGSSSFVISFAITSTTVCFVDPTTAMVRLTDGGTRSVDALQPGDRVAVLGVGAAPARVVGVHRTQHAGRVIMIGANMLGYRHNELRLTEGHLVAQWLANRRIRLMPAGALPTSQQTRTTTVAHVSLDRNDLLCVNGVWVESADTTGAAATARIAKLYATLAQRNVACHHR